jgi:anti-anti-sigma factor
VTVLFPPVQHPPGRIIADREAGVRVLRLVGEIDAMAVDAFEAGQVRALGEEPVRGRAASVIDLSAVTFLSSSAVSFLLRHTRAIRDRGGVPILRGLNSHTSRVLSLTGVLSLFQHTA